MAQSHSPFKPLTPSPVKAVVRNVSAPATIPNPATPQPAKPAVPPPPKAQPAPPAAPAAKPAAPATKPQGGESDRRRSQRVLLVVQLEISWVSKDGIRVKEHAETEVVSQHGGMLKMGTKLPVGAQIEISRTALGKSMKAKVVGTSNPGQDGMARVAIELAAPSDNFWGINFPPLP